LRQRFPKQFSIRRMNQRMGSQNLFQRGKWSARRKEQAAPREFHSLFLRSRFKLSDGAVSKTSRLGPHSRNELAGLPRQHLFRRVIGLPKFISESFHKVNSLPRQHYR
jgi:hypothetical protein